MCKELQNETYDDSCLVPVELCCHRLIYYKKVKIVKIIFVYLIF